MDNTQDDLLKELWSLLETGQTDKVNDAFKKVRSSILANLLKNAMQKLLNTFVNLATYASRSSQNKTQTSS